MEVCPVFIDETGVLSGSPQQQPDIDLRNLYFSFPDVQFHAMILDRLDNNYSLARWHGDVWEAYADPTRTLLERRLDRDVFAIADLQGKPDDSPVYGDVAISLNWTTIPPAMRLPRCARNDRLRKVDTHELHLGQDTAS